MADGGIIALSGGDLSAELAELTGNGDLDSIRSDSEEGGSGLIVPGGRSDRARDFASGLNQSSFDDMRRDCLSGTCEDGNGNLVGETDLRFYNAQGFLHGPDILLPVGLMLEDLLEVDENISTIQSIVFGKIMKSNLTLFASVGKAPVLSEEEAFDDKPAVRMRFRTTHDRMIYVCGYENGQAVKKDTYEPGPLISRIIPDRAGMDSAGDAEQRGFEMYRVFLNGLDEGEFSAQEIDLYMHLLAELPMTFMRKLEGNGLIKKRNNFAAGCRGFHLPDPDHLFNGQGAMILKMREDLTRTTPNGFCMLPIDVEFVHRLDDFVYGGGRFWATYPANEVRENGLAVEVLGGLGGMGIEDRYT